MIWGGFALERGDRGGAVRDVQTELARAGFSPGEPDGIFGPLTERAVKALQRRANREQTGAYGLREARWLAGAHRVQEDERTAAAGFLRGFGVASVMDSPMTQHVAEILVSAKAGELDRFAEAAGDYDVHEINAWVAWIANYFADLGVREERQNRGPLVDPIIRVGGGRPEDAPPWCAYFVAFCRRVAVWAWRECNPSRSDVVFDFPVSGGAARTWLRAGDDALAHDMRPPIGAAYHRTRTGNPVSHADIVRGGQSLQGHTGIVAGFDHIDPAMLLCVGGNSSGAGHSSSSRGGRVAPEVVGPSRDNPQAHAAWERLVGYTIITVTE